MIKKYFDNLQHAVQVPYSHYSDIVIIFMPKYVAVRGNGTYKNVINRNFNSKHISKNLKDIAIYIDGLSSSYFAIRSSIDYSLGHLTFSVRPRDS